MIQSRYRNLSSAFEYGISLLKFSCHYYFTTYSTPYYSIKPETVNRKTLQQAYVMVQKRKPLSKNIWNFTGNLIRLYIYIFIPFSGGVDLFRMLARLSSRFNTPVTQLWWYEVRETLYSYFQWNTMKLRLLGSNNNCLWNTHFLKKNLKFQFLSPIFVHESLQIKFI